MSETAFDNANIPKSQIGDPTWEIARLFPVQGQWQETDYFELHSNRLVELVAGRLEVLPMPTWLHQLIVQYLCDRLSSYVSSRIGGTVLFAPLPIRLFGGTIREPDVLYFAPENAPKDKRGYPERVDLVMEVVSDGEEAHKRDYQEKRSDYARGGVPEYWIVDYNLSQITVLVLRDGNYCEAGVYKAGQNASSVLIPGFEIEIDRLLELGR